MTKEQIITNHIDWIFPQFKLDKGSNCCDIMWGAFRMVRIYSKLYNNTLLYYNTLDYYNHFDKHFAAYFPDDLYLIKTIMKHKIQDLFL